MPITEGFGAESSGNKEWKPVSEGVYQVVIKDIDVKEVKKYKSEKMTTQYLFKMVILDGDSEENQLQMVTAFVSRNWFKGASKKAFNPSKLVTLTKALYSFYYPKLDVSLLEAEDMSEGVINDMIGKQLKVVVKLNEEETSSKVSDFMVIKKELDVPEEVKIAETSLLSRPKISKIADANESVEAKEVDAKDASAVEGSDLPF